MLPLLFTVFVIRIKKQDIIALQLLSDIDICVCVYEIIRWIFEKG